MLQTLTSGRLRARNLVVRDRGGAGVAAMLALAAGLALLLLVGGASVWQAQQNRKVLERARETRRQLTTVMEVLIAAQNAETGQRGFLLTRDPEYLLPLDRGVAAMPGLIGNLQASRPEDRRVRELEDVVGQKFAELKQSVALAQNGDMAGALALVRTNVGLQEMRTLRALVSDLETALDASLAEEVAEITDGDRQLIAIDATGLLMVALLATMIGVGLRSYLANLRAAQDQAAAAHAALERNNWRLDEEVRRRTADLTEANQEIQRFAYIVSHDLRAPLVNIMGFTSEMEHAAGRVAGYVTGCDAPGEVQEAITGDIPEALRFIKSSTEKMDRLINAILKLSREGRRILAAERVAMGALFAAIADSMTHQAARQDAEVTVGAVPDLLADRLAVEQVFSNVIDNALKYLKPGRPGRIRISGRVEGAMVRFDITDNGRGIAERDYERVFELFRRAGDQTVPGEGIGLAHVRALVRRLGGTIECSSTVDVGTTFTVRLPVAPQYHGESRD